MTPVSVVLACARGPFAVVLELEQSRVRPVQHLELPEMEHLIAPVDGDRVVAGRPHEVLVPFGAIVVEVAPAVDQHVVPTPPDVEMQHVDLREAIEQRAASERGERTLPPGRAARDSRCA